MFRARQKICQPRARFSATMTYLQASLVPSQGMRSCLGIMRIKMMPFQSCICWFKLCFSYEDKFGLEDTHLKVFIVASSKTTTFSNIAKSMLLGHIRPYSIPTRPSILRTKFGRVWIPSRLSFHRTKSGQTRLQTGGIPDKYGTYQKEPISIAEQQKIPKLSLCR